MGKKDKVVLETVKTVVVKEPEFDFKAGYGIMNAKLFKISEFVNEKKSEFARGGVPQYYINAINDIANLL